MIYTPLTIQAARIAYEAHHGQQDKSGMPYIFHPYHLAEQMPDEITVCTALLHDVVEDTSVTIDELKKYFPEEVTDAVRLLTHQKGTDYFEYIRALAKNPIARIVKLADLAHNSDESRLTGCSRIPLEEALRLRQKYARAKAILEENGI